MKIEIITLFPELLAPFFTTSLIGKATESGTLEFELTNLRDYSEPPHHHVDDTPYGGGPGMVLKPEPLSLAIEDAKKRLPNAKVICLSPAGATFTQKKAQEISEESALIFLCGRYEGFDQRILDLYVDQEISIGDYILMGGEVGVMAIVEASTRLLDGVIGNADSLSVESFSSKAAGHLEAPQYTRPATFKDKEVPEVLLSGDHQKIQLWREEQSQKLTKERRPDLLKDKVNRSKE